MFPYFVMYLLPHMAFAGQQCWILQPWPDSNLTMRKLQSSMGWIQQLKMQVDLIYKAYISYCNIYCYPGIILLYVCIILPYTTPAELADVVVPSAVAAKYAPQYLSSDCASAVLISRYALSMTPHWAFVVCNTYTLSLNKFYE